MNDKLTHVHAETLIQMNLNIWIVGTWALQKRLFPINLISLILLRQIKSNFTILSYLSKEKNIYTSWQLCCLQTFE